jgi:hypothetical protein
MLLLLLSFRFLVLLFVTLHDIFLAYCSKVVLTTTFGAYFSPGWACQSGATQCFTTTATGRTISTTTTVMGCQAICSTVSSLQSFDEPIAILLIEVEVGVEVGVPISIPIGSTSSTTVSCSDPIAVPICIRCCHWC